MPESKRNSTTKNTNSVTIKYVEAGKQDTIIENISEIKENTLPNNGIVKSTIKKVIIGSLGF